MKSIAVLALLASVLAGCGPASPPFAPEDLAFTLPREVNGRELTVATFGADERPDYFSGANGERLRRFVSERGKSGSDVLVAMASGYDRLGYTMIAAVRVRGVVADELEKFIFSQASPAVPIKETQIGGKSVKVGEGSEEEGANIVYSKGEVLYVVMTDDPSDAAAAVEALP
jgi:hypothetical protein